jgi:hypothetical protein
MVGGQWVGLAGQTVLMNAGHVVGVGLGGQNVGCAGHRVCWVGQAVGASGVREGPQSAPFGGQ